MFQVQTCFLVCPFPGLHTSFHFTLWPRTQVWPTLAWDPISLLFHCLITADQARSPSSPALTELLAWAGIQGQICQGEKVGQILPLCLCRNQSQLPWPHLSQSCHCSSLGGKDGLSYRQCYIPFSPLKKKLRATSVQHLHPRGAGLLEKPKSSM